jgi:hypothetical protein
VLVASGGAAGDVALYVFSTDGPRGSHATLRPVLRLQSLFRVSVRVVGGRTLRYSVPAYAPGDELCCPAAIDQRDMRWNARRARFELVAKRRLATA